VTRTIELSEQAYAVVCGMVQMTEDVDPDGVVVEKKVWDEVRELFPKEEFFAALVNGELSYEPEPAA
jgi:hypothetical protein